jgi:hypothetical protein
MTQRIRIVLSGLLAASGCMTSGCMTIDAPAWTSKGPARPTAVAASAPPPPPVSADQITERNASEMVEALREELDYAADKPHAPTAEPRTAGTRAK